MIVADEGLNGKIVKQLRSEKYKVDWILEIKSGISDRKVIEYAKAKGKILITEDKDFGEWVFAHKITGLTIIFLRYEKNDFDRVVRNLSHLLSEIIIQSKSRDEKEFITINKNKIRRRNI